MSRVLTSFGRVVDVIYNEKHPRYKEMGLSQSLYGVFYRLLGRNIEEDQNEFLDFAYCGNLESNLPLKGEIIQLEVLPSEKEYSLYPSVKTYWTKIIPIWNHPQHGCLPDITRTQEQLQELDLGFSLKEDPEVRPIDRKPGERVWEGRWGQYVKQGIGNGRFSKNDNQDPFLEVETGKNTSSSSLILSTSHHTVDVDLPSNIFSTYRESPPVPRTYKGSQNLSLSDLNTLVGRRHILLSSGDSIGVTSKEVHLDAKKEVGINGERVYLGADKARTESEACLKGTSTVEWLGDLTEILTRVVLSLSDIPADPATALPIIIQNNKAIQEILPLLKKRMEGLKSKKIFVE